jgi:hypothetical protein
MGVVIMALLLLPRSALGHTAGLSVADFKVQADGHVEARLTFASVEPRCGLALDSDGDGVVNPEEVSAARDDLQAFLLQGIEVGADGSPCAPAFRDASLTEVDGLLLRASYACASDAADIVVTLYYLSGLSYGCRAIARIEAGSATTEGVLTGEHRAIALHLAGLARKEKRGGRRAPRAVALAIAVGLIGLLAYGSWRWRSAYGRIGDRERRK